MNKILPGVLVGVIIMTMTLSSCYNSTDWRISLNDSTLTDAQKDSITFVGKKHYGINYNFIITADSIHLISQEPEEYLQSLI